MDKLDRFFIKTDKCLLENLGEYMSVPCTILKFLSMFEIFHNKKMGRKKLLLVWNTKTLPGNLTVSPWGIESLVDGPHLSPRHCTGIIGQAFDRHTSLHWIFPAEKYTAFSVSLSVHSKFNNCGYRYDKVYDNYIISVHKSYSYFRPRTGEKMVAVNRKINYFPTRRFYFNISYKKTNLCVNSVYKIFLAYLWAVFKF